MKLRFVVVDDAAFLRELLKNILSEMNALCVGEAADGNEALEVVGNTLPDLILLDMVMPGKNGIEVASQIKLISPDTKIMGCSTVDQESLIQKALESGFDAYITKPFTKEQIKENVLKLFPHWEEMDHGRT